MRFESVIRLVIAVLRSLVSRIARQALLDLMRCQILMAAFRDGLRIKRVADWCAGPAFLVPLAGSGATQRTILTIMGSVHFTALLAGSTGTIKFFDR